VTHINASLFVDMSKDYSAMSVKNFAIIRAREDPALDTGASQPGFGQMFPRSSWGARFRKKRAPGR
jgi:hypothetical protein